MIFLSVFVCGYVLVVDSALVSLVYIVDKVVVLSILLLLLLLL